MTEKKKHSLKIRMLLMMTSLILAVFVMIILVFNVLITQYIENNANEVLSQSRSFQPAEPKDGSAAPDKPGTKPKQTPSGDAEMVMVSGDFQVRLPKFFPEDINLTASLDDFTEAVKAKKITLDAEGILKLQTDLGLYYYTSVVNPESEGGYLVFFINMTNLYSFEKNLSTMLLWIMGAALLVTILLTYLISSRIAGPVEELSEFAKRIGEGDYKPLDKDFADRELHELKLSMNETGEKLMAYDTEQRVFFQNASHELRTPLQIIKTNAEAIEHNLIPKEKAASVIRRETDQLSELVEDIIVLSRLDARSRDMVYKTADLRETLSYTMERFTSLLNSKNIRVDYDFQETPVTFSYDERSMERAFQNLVSNAVRYSRGIIKVTCKTMENRIMIKVFDDGPGISQDDLPRIFDRFYKGREGVHGIGLSIVKSIITAYRGRIEVASSPAGTTFTLFLPMAGEEPRG